jgi:hypothetical protein
MTKTLLATIFTCGVFTAEANLFHYSVRLDGPTEPSSSPGLGIGLVSYDDVAHTLQVQVTFFGLVTSNSTGVTAAHIHAATVNPFSGTAGVATPTPTFPGFPSGVYGGSYSNLFNLTLASSWNASYISNNGGTPGTAEVALASAMATGRAYWNIHSSAFSGGEIRGFLTPTVVPEPSSYALLAIGSLAMGAFTLGRRRMKSR